MSTYINSIHIGILTFFFVSQILIVPFSIYQYRKHSYVNKWRVLVIFSFVLYLICAYYLVILPLPATRDIASMQSAGTQHTQLIPFHFVVDIAKYIKATGSDVSIVYLLTSHPVIQVLFNVLLLLPLGFYVHYIFERTWLQTIIIVFLTSLFFEITQLTGLYGYYNAPYRLFDVDDLITNTFGGIIGYGLAGFSERFLPEYDELDKHVKSRKLKVSFFRRTLSLAIDYLVFSFIALLILPSKYVNYLSDPLMLLLIGAWLYVTNGRTPGLWLTQTKVVEVGQQKIAVSVILKRLFWFYLTVFLIPNIIAILLSMTSDVLGNTILSVMMLGYYPILYIYAYLQFRRHKKFLYERKSNTELIVSLTNKEI